MAPQGWLHDFVVIGGVVDIIVVVVVVGVVVSRWNDGTIRCAINDNKLEASLMLWVLLSSRHIITPLPLYRK